MFKPKFRNAFGLAEKQAVMNVINYYSELSADPPYDGFFQKRFENDFSVKMGGGYSRAVSTGSVACFIAIRALSLKKGGEVLVSGVTDSGSIFAIVEAGLVPVIVDTSPNSYLSLFEQFKNAITSNTVALFIVHAGGLSVPLDELKTLCFINSLKLIEDCSQSPFAKFCRQNCSCDINSCEGQYVGSVGDVAAFSTMYRKSLHTGGSGGVVYTKDASLYNRIIEESDRGRPKYSSNYRSRDPGHAKLSALNHNTDEFSCAIGSASLERIDDTKLKRLLFVKQINRVLANSMLLSLAPFSNGDSPFFLHVIVKDEFIEHKKKIIDLLRNHGVEVSDDYQCIVAEWDCLHAIDHKVYQSKNAVLTKQKSFNLFFNEQYTEDDAIKICEIVKNIENNLI
jgi:dTDP-4-amino-4,6-dideoxygalactose transaminase